MDDDPELQVMDLKLLFQILEEFRVVYYFCTQKNHYKLLLSFTDSIFFYNFWSEDIFLLVWIKLMNPLILNPTKSLILLSFSLLLIFLGQFSRLTNCPKKWDHCHLCILLQIKHSVLLRIFALKFFAKEVWRCQRGNQKL